MDSNRLLEFQYPIGIDFNTLLELVQYVIGINVYRIRIGSMSTPCFRFQIRQFHAFFSLQSVRCFQDLHFDYRRQEAPSHLTAH